MCQISGSDRTGVDVVLLSFPFSGCEHLEYSGGCTEDLVIMFHHMMISDGPGTKKKKKNIIPPQPSLTSYIQNQTTPSASRREHTHCCPHHSAQCGAPCVVEPPRSFESRVCLACLCENTRGSGLSGFSVRAAARRGQNSWDSLSSEQGHLSGYLTIWHGESDSSRAFCVEIPRNRADRHSMQTIWKITWHPAQKDVRHTVHSTSSCGSREI